MTGGQNPQKLVTGNRTQRCGSASSTLVGERQGQKSPRIGDLWGCRWWWGKAGERLPHPRLQGMLHPLSSAGACGASRSSCCLLLPPPRPCLWVLPAHPPHLGTHLLPPARRVSPSPLAPMSECLLHLMLLERGEVWGGGCWCLQQEGKSTPSSQLQEVAAKRHVNCEVLYKHLPFPASFFQDPPGGSRDCTGRSFGGSRGLKSYSGIQGAGATECVLPGAEAIAYW